MMKKLLFNPFEKYAESKLLAFGLMATLLGSYLGFVFKARFDGVIDMHLPEKIILIQPFIDNLINALCLFAVLFILGKSINKKTRIIDILNPVLIARIPFYLLTFANIGDYMYRVTENLLASIDLKSPPTQFNIEPLDMAFLVIFSIISIAFLVWFVILLFNGFKVATNSKGVRHNILFAGAIIIAEILSKFIIPIIN